MNPIREEALFALALEKPTAKNSVPDGIEEIESKDNKGKTL